MLSSALAILTKDKKWYFCWQKRVNYTRHGHKLRFLSSGKAQFVTAGIIEIIEVQPKILKRVKNASEGGDAGRVEALKALNYKGNRNRLMEKKDEIIVHLEENPPATQKEAQAKIKELTGIQRSLPQVREFLKKTGFFVAR